MKGDRSSKDPKRNTPREECSEALVSSPPDNDADNMQGSNKVLGPKGIAPAGQDKESVNKQPSVPAARPLTPDPSSPTGGQGIADSQQPDPAPTLDTPGGTETTTSQAPTITVYPPAGTVNQKTIHAFETFTPHPADPTKMNAHIRLPIPHVPDTYYSQTDTIPMYDKNVPSPTNPTFYFIPPLHSAKVPQRRRANKLNSFTPPQWTRVPGSQEIWTRPNPARATLDTWSFVGVFRRFCSTTHKYEQIHTNAAKLAGIDPNDKGWQYAYNKWIDQMRRRRDAAYIKEVSKDHWSHAERRALYGAINAFVRRAGLAALGFGAGTAMGSAHVSAMTEAVNKAGGKGRLRDAVKSQIASAHRRKNKAIFDLLARAEVLRARVARGEKVRRDEMYPEEAIERGKWPEDSDTTPRTGKSGREGEEGVVSSDKGEQRGHLDKMPLETIPELRSSSHLRSDQAETSELETQGPAPNSPTVKIYDTRGNEFPNSDLWSDSHGSPSKAESDAANTDIDAVYNEEDVQTWKINSSSSSALGNQNNEREKPAHREAMDVQLAALNSLRDQGRAVPSSSDDIDSDSDSDTIPAVAPPKGRKRQRETTPEREVVGDGDVKAHDRAASRVGVKRLRR
jgi:hypothetical protein